jgi:hypothetical protein
MPLGPLASETAGFGQGLVSHTWPVRLLRPGKRRAEAGAGGLAGGITDRKAEFLGHEEALRSTSAGQGPSSLLGLGGTPMLLHLHLSTSHAFSRPQ